MERVLLATFDSSVVVDLILLEITDGIVATADRCVSSTRVWNQDWEWLNNLSTAWFKLSSSLVEKTVAMISAMCDVMDASVIELMVDWFTGSKAILPR